MDFSLPQWALIDRWFRKLNEKWMTFEHFILVYQQNEWTRKLFADTNRISISKCLWFWFAHGSISNSIFDFVLPEIIAKSIDCIFMWAESFSFCLQSAILLVNFCALLIDSFDLMDDYNRLQSNEYSPYLFTAMTVIPNWKRALTPKFHPFHAIWESICWRCLLNEPKKKNHTSEMFAHKMKLCVCACVCDEKE